MQRTSRISKSKRTFNAISYVVGVVINHLFIGKKVILSLFNKINKLSASLVCKTYGYKQSFSMISLAMYLMISALAVSITLGAIAIVDNAKIARTIDEIEYYQKANSEFIVRYSALPGLVPYSECLRFADFNDVCRNQNDINLTTSENVYKSTTNDCHHDMGCIIETNGKAGNEDIMRNFLLPMRYLKTAGLIDTIMIGLETELDENEDYSDKVWAKSRVDKELYINIYNYYNPTRNTSKPFLFTGQTIFGHTINSDASFDHYNKLAKSNNQYLIYLKKSETPRGAISAKVAHKIDRKFDDGKPMTGRLTTFSTSTFSDDFENSEYAGCITAQPNDKENLDDISYNISKTDGYCNIAYQLQNFSSTVIENDKTTLLTETKYENGTRYKTYSDGTVISNDKIDEETNEGYEIVYTYADGTTKSMTPTCSCNAETKILSCKYEDNSTKSFYPLGDVCAYNETTGTQTCTYEDGSTCNIELDKNDYQNNCTLNGSTMTCTYTNTGAIPVQQSYTTIKKDCGNNVAGEICNNGTNYNCDTFNNKIIGTCPIYGIGYCNSNTVGHNCNDGSGNPANYKCGTLGDVINTKHQACIQKSSKACENKSGDCVAGDNYVCDTFGNEIYGTCQQTSTADCENENGTCTAGNKYKCKVSLYIIANSCTAYSFSDCANNTEGQACQSGSNHYCRLFDNKIVDCQAYAYDQECSDRNGICANGNAYACTTLDGEIKDGTCREISYKYCKKVNDTYSDCQDAPTSTSHTSHCKFYGNTNTNVCETKSTSSRYCTAKTTAYNSCHTSPQSTSEKFYCPFVGDVHAGECDPLTPATKDCTNNKSGDKCNAGSVATGNYSCPTVSDIIAGTCTEYKGSYCTNNAVNKKCTTGSDVDGNYYCITLSDNIKTAQLISHKYCKKVNDTYSDCQDTPTSTSHTSHCKFYGNTNTKDCKTENVSYQYCTGDGTGCKDTIELGSKYYCSFINSNKVSCSGATYKYCTGEGTGCSDSISSGSKYYCTFVNGKKATCSGATYKYCTGEGTGCKDSIEESSRYYCSLLNGKKVSCSGSYNSKCRYDSGYCDDTLANYNCVLVGNDSIATCTPITRTLYCTSPEAAFSGACDDYDYGQYYSCVFEGTTLKSCTERMQTLYCKNNSGTCDTSGDAYYCPTVNNTISGTCTARSYKYCTSLDATTCAIVPTNSSYIYYCKFYGSTKKSCRGRVQQ